MNRKIVFYMTGRILLVLALLFILPMACAVIYKETSIIHSLGMSAVISFVSGLILTLCFKTENRYIFAREGFAIVSLAWLSVSLVGALPFYISGEIPNYINAFFETVSGFTTTGASILTDVESMSHGLLFWRSFTHFIGGMGVLVFVMAIIPSESGRDIHIMRAEMPGPIVGKLVPKIRETAKILYLIYIGLTAFMVVALLVGGMSVFDSLIHTFGTAGTGGFGIKADSVGDYSPYLQWVIGIFMLLFGINFNLFYLILIGKLRSAFKSSELWCYIGIVCIATAAVCINIFNTFSNLGDAIRHSFFQVSSIITTTGFSTVDFNSWPNFSKMVLLLLMFIGGCAGSTAGGLKVSRVMILIKTAKRDLNKMLHPRSVGVVKHEGKVIDEGTVSNISVYLIVYTLCFFAILTIISLENISFEGSFSAVASCFNNVGPAFGTLSQNYSSLSDVSTISLSLAMLFGRLEIFPLLLTLSPSTWIKK